MSASCRSCRSPGLVPFLDLGTSPLADAFPRSPYEPEAFYPLRLAVCESCWLVQLLDVVPDAKLYNADYGFYTGASPSSIAYFAEYADWAMGRWPDKRLVVEIASNDGTLLSHFAKAGYPAVGVEPSANVAQVALGAGLEVLVEPFGRKAAADIVSAHGHAGLVIANNVVAHVSDLDDFLGGIADLLASDGRAIIEFQYVADLLTGNQFDHVYHEHRSYFSLTSLGYALERHGLAWLSAHETPAQGGSLRVVVLRGPRIGREVQDNERWLTRMSAYAGMQGRVERVRERLLGLIEGEHRNEHRLAGYAASAKSTTLLNYCGIGPATVPYVLDTTPAKIGRYTPGTHIPIVAKAEADTYLLLAWNYLPGVLRRERAFLDRGGRFIVPIPQPVLL